MRKIIKWLVFALLLWALYRRLRGEDWPGFLAQSAQAWRQKSHLLLLAVLLVPLNWFLEVNKWRALMYHNGQLPARRQAWMAIITGLIFSLFTPARVGDYLGRAMQAGPFGKWRAVQATFLGGLLQWFLMLALGLPAWALLKTSWPTSSSVIAMWSLLLLLASIAFLSLSHWHNLLLALLNKISKTHLPKGKVGRNAVLGGFRQMAQKLQNTPLPPLSHLAKALAWGSSRYLLYSLQLYLLLLFFGLKLGVAEGLAGIWLIFLLQSGLPLPTALGNTLLRTELAFLVWDQPHASGIFAAMTALFVLNLALPALLGAAFLVKIKEHQNKSNESKIPVSPL